MSILSDMIDEKIGVEEAASKALKDVKRLRDYWKELWRNRIRSGSIITMFYCISQNMIQIYYTLKWDYLADLLTSDNCYNRYIVINQLARLVKVDKEHKFEAYFDRYFDNIAGEKTMVAGQAALNAGKITKAKPNLQAKITYTLFNIDRFIEANRPN